jgi:hypothetical protein
MSDGPDFEKSSRETVTQALAKGGTVAACVALIGQRIAGAARSGGDAHKAVVDVTRGGIGAFLLNGHQDVAAAAIALLEALPNLSLMTQVGPEEVMTWVMEGIAAVAAMAPAEVNHDIRGRIDEKFMGAGEIFGNFVDKARQQG